jgi:hypothetical protein
MSIDLQELFGQAGRQAPPASIDEDHVISRGRRIRARRRAAKGTTTFIGVGVVALGSVALAGVLPGGFRGQQGPAVVGPATHGPAVAGGKSTAPQPEPTDTPAPPETPSPRTKSRSAGLEGVALPDPAPGFPFRRADDSVEEPMQAPDGGVVHVNTYLLAKQAPTITTDAEGNETGGTPNGPEATLIVGELPAPQAGPDGTIEGHHVVETPRVAGVTGRVTTYTEKGTPIRTLYFTSGGFNVEVTGFGGVTTRELVALGDALTGLD